MNSMIQKSYLSIFYLFPLVLCLSFTWFIEEKFPTLNLPREGKSQLGVGRGGPRPGGRRRLKYDRDHMAKAQKLTSLKRT